MTIYASAKYAKRSSSRRRAAIRSPAAFASTSASVNTAPCCGTSSMSAWPASGRLWMSARRYHDERCQKRLAAASASPWVASRRSAVARYGASTAGSRGRTARTLERLNASLVGQIALLPKPSASRWYGVSVRVASLPEKTVMIVTFCPSSRRLAMSPPQESATSSGWGATKTWVMAGEYTDHPGPDLRPTACAAKGHEDARAVAGGGQRRAAPLHEDQLLLSPTAHGNHQPPTVGELLDQRVRHVGRRRGHDDPRPWRVGRPAQASVADPDLDASPEGQRLDTRASRIGKLRQPLDAQHVAAHRREHGRLVAGPRPDLQHAAARRRIQQLGHERDHPGLADRLARPDSHGLVRVGEITACRGDEPFAWNNGHRSQHALVHDPARPQLHAEHRGASRFERALVSRPIHAPEHTTRWCDAYSLDGAGGELGAGGALEAGARRPRRPSPACTLV